MNTKSVLNGLIIGTMLLILYLFVGHAFMKFYMGDKAEMLAAAESINRQCAEQAACPTKLPGWQQQYSGQALSRGSMLYFTSDETADGPQSFRLVYSFFMPDNWFEASGGVGKAVTAGWTGRP